MPKSSFHEIRSRRTRAVPTIDAPAQLLESLEQYLPASAHTASGGGTLSQVDRRTMVLDVQRSVAHWDVHKGLKISRRIRKRKDLLRVLQTVAQTTPKFRYYQGFHEVCLVILEVCENDVDQAVGYIRQLVMTDFAPIVFEDFQHSLIPLLAGIEFIVSVSDPELYAALEESGVGYHFAVPWILTWLSHSLDKFADICLVYRFLLQASRGGRDRTTIMYLCAAIVLLDRDRILLHGANQAHVFHSLQTSIRTVDMTNATGFAIELRMHVSVKHLSASTTHIASLLPGRSLSCTTFRVCLAIVPVVAAIAFARIFAPDTSVSPVQYISDQFRL